MVVVTSILAFMAGAITGIICLALIQARRKLDFDEEVRLWEETHLNSQVKQKVSDSSTKLTDLHEI